MPQTSKPSVSAPESGKGEENWRDLFYLYNFINISLTDRVIERRELVWIKRHLINQGKAHLLTRMYEIVECGGCNQEELQQLMERAAAELSISEKRRFIYNLAQLFQSKGSLSTLEYENILDLSEKVGLPDTDADAIVNSVYSVNNTFIAIIGLLALCVILYFGAVVIVPLIIALFISMIINKAESRLASTLSLCRFRWLTKLGTMVLILGGLFGLVMVAVVSGKDIATRIPYYEAKIDAALKGSATAQKALAWLHDKGILEQLKKIPFGSSISSYLGSLITLLGYFLLVVVFTGFLVFSTSSSSGILQEMNDKIGAYIGVKALINLFIGALTFILCLIFGIDFAFFWGVLAFILNFIPSVGSVIAIVPPILLTLIQLNSWTLIVLFIVLLVVPNILLGQVFEPKLMGQKMAIKPLAILLGLIFWGLLWGIPGMFLATPLMVLLRLLSSYFNFSRRFERLIAADNT